MKRHLYAVYESGPGLVMPDAVHFTRTMYKVRDLMRSLKRDYQNAGMVVKGSWVQGYHAYPRDAKNGYMRRIYWEMVPQENLEYIDADEIF